MTTRREARASILGACLLGVVVPALAWAQTRQPIPDATDQIFFIPPPAVAIPLIIFALVMGAYAYHKGRLTPMRVIATALALMAVFAMPRLVHLMRDWTW